MESCGKSYMYICVIFVELKKENVVICLGVLDVDYFTNSENTTFGGL